MHTVLDGRNTADTHHGTSNSTPSQRDSKPRTRDGPYRMLMVSSYHSGLYHRTASRRVARFDVGQRRPRTRRHPLRRRRGHDRLHQGKASGDRTASVEPRPREDFAYTWSYSWVDRWWQKLLRAAAVSNFYLHDLKRMAFTAASAIADMFAGLACYLQSRRSHYRIPNQGQSSPAT